MPNRHCATGAFVVLECCGVTCLGSPAGSNLQTHHGRTSMQLRVARCVLPDEAFSMLTFRNPPYVQFRRQHSVRLIGSARLTQQTLSIKDLGHLYRPGAETNRRARLMMGSNRRWCRTGYYCGELFIKSGADRCVCHPAEFCSGLT
ncbi:hypothetical protein HDV57DRAFT_421484 [Trichoderma longibrachiatum]|uniref:Secreted protein n=1 Tax=Trichoderma longibrachiatum ATCC 18648 TaxID=983965 RepID=A0A2T4C358_TRILO|nr:hypothetical protein M440DRAFT_1266014 [Trichoderma longibrachiatum ATCC 18648]